MRLTRNWEKLLNDITFFLLCKEHFSVKQCAHLADFLHMLSFFFTKQLKHTLSNYHSTYPNYNAHNYEWITRRLHCCVTHIGVTSHSTVHCVVLPNEDGNVVWHILASRPNYLPNEDGNVMWHILASRPNYTLGSFTKRRWQCYVTHIGVTSYSAIHWDVANEDGN